MSILGKFTNSLFVSHMIAWGRNRRYPEGAWHFEYTLPQGHTAPYRCCFLVTKVSVNGNVTFEEVNLIVIKLKMENILQPRPRTLLVHNLSAILKRCSLSSELSPRSFGICERPAKQE